MEGGGGDCTAAAAAGPAPVRGGGCGGGGGCGDGQKELLEEAMLVLLFPIAPAAAQCAPVQRVFPRRCCKWKQYTGPAADVAACALAAVVSVPNCMGMSRAPMHGFVLLEQWC